MGLRELYETDQELEEAGAWVALGEGVSLRIRSLKSKKLNALAESHQRRFYRKGFTSTEEQETIATEQAVAAISDWRGVTDEQDKPLPCTPENVRAVLGKYRWLRDDIRGHMASRETFRREELAAAGKGSATPSDAA